MFCNNSGSYDSHGSVRTFCRQVTLSYTVTLKAIALIIIKSSAFRDKSDTATRLRD